MKKKIGLERIILILVMLAASVTILILAKQKAGMHVDEYYSYGLANHEDNGDIYIIPELGVKMSAEDVFRDYFFADGFSIKNVWKNQGYDVHPPFYYLLMHIWGLLTHNALALKSGILLNILFHLASIWLVFLIANHLKQNKYFALLCAATYAFMPMVLGNIIFVRMYAMLATLILLLSYFFMVNYDTEKRGVRFYVTLGVISVLGTMTHYYFLLYLFFSCFLWGLGVLFQKKYEEAGFLVLTMTASGGLCIAIFPKMLKHIFIGYRGEESFNNLVYSDFFDSLKYYWKVLDQLFGGYALFWLLIIIVGILFMTLTGNGDKKQWWKKELFLLIPTAGYYFVVVKIAVAHSTRYLSPIYGPLVLLVLLGIYRIGSMLKESGAKALLMICTAGFLLNAGWTTYSWPELYADQEECIKTAREYGENNECIFVFNRIWRGMVAYPEFIQYQQMSFIPDDRLELLNQDIYKDYDHVMIYVDKKIGEEKIEDILNVFAEQNQKIEGYEKLYSYSYNDVYYFD